MSDRSVLRLLYRSEDTYTGYSAGNPAALARFRKLLRAERRSFGRRLLDLGCGGGALARAYVAPGRAYTGVDANPDMIREAKLAAQKFGYSATFRLADLRRVRLTGKYDTVTLLGNALSHLTTRDLVRTVQNLRGHLSPAARLLVDYRDTVQQFFDKQGHGSFTQHRGGHRWVSSTRGVDLQRGVILVTIHRDGARAGVAHGQAIWSPFVLEPLISTQGWKLVRRRPDRTWHGWRDIYQLAGTV